MDPLEVSPRKETKKDIRAPIYWVAVMEAAEFYLFQVRDPAINPRPSRRPLIHIASHVTSIYAFNPPQ